MSYVISLKYIIIKFYLNCLLSFSQTTSPLYVAP